MDKKIITQADKDRGNPHNHIRTTLLILIILTLKDRLKAQREQQLHKKESQLV
jgi:hypothetical protein